ncbi:hypothetical protein CPTAKMNP4_103 [Salmonella phage vB_SenM-AKM_NP4]|uniref:Uncharacterized protein n=1 Tax=Salmonella phage S16 TaxID=1087482 RepID=M1EAM3_BPS16|nr:hypothetical protein I133_gp166 [Salmonella phage vB_SenM-S16]AEO97064.1 hypothetical protein [Salmonella phage vB_SenM-S16]WDR21768.1 hypothetical protein PJM34_0100 [Salmonella phage vB_SenM_UTK0003]WLI71728.1 hypothetical protein CPTAKMNP4_103 [Salmonella phage vB_SenM-AKM_NP4]
MKAKFEDFVPGRVLYHVYGIHRTETEVSEESIDKLIVLSHPFLVDFGYSKSWFVKHIRKYKSFDGIKEYVTESSLADMGVETSERSTVYNLNRVFTNFGGAIHFCAELKDNEFSDPKDAEYAKNNSPIDEKAFLKSFNF